jgi:hypothetical protein
LEILQRFLELLEHFFWILRDNLDFTQATLGCFDLFSLLEQKFLLYLIVTVED